MSDVRHAPPSRRGVLVGGAALLLVGCTRSSDPEPAPGPTRDQRLAARAAREIRALVAAYAATVARHPGLRAELSPLAAEHGAHLTGLTALTRPEAASTPASPTASRSRPTSESTAAPPAVPGSAVAARLALADAERAAGSRRRVQALRAGPELARLLASVAACEVVHAALLGGRG